MHLERALLAGFQSYDSQVSMDLERDVTLLAGRNNVGKTAFLRALQLAADSNLSVAGAKPNFRLEYQWTDIPSDLIASAVDARQPWAEPLLKAIRAVDRQRVSVAFFHRSTDPETLPGLPDVPEQPTFGSSSVLNALVVWRVELPDVGITQEWARTPQGIRTFAWTAGPLADQEAKAKGWMHGGLAEFASGAAQLCTGSFYVMPRRVGSESTQFAIEDSLAADGSNLTNVVASLLTNKPDVFESLAAFMRIAFPEISHLRIPMRQTQSGLSPSAEIHIQFGGRPSPVPLRYCGTGIEQLLVLSVGILTSAAGKLFLLDEPHAYLHPHAERILLAFLRDHREHQYIVATHSNLLLSSVALSTVRLVSLVDGWTSVTSVSSSDAIFAEIGVTAADLWGSDYILWVEGPSEKAIIETVVDRLAPRRGLVVRPMPATSRFGAASHKVAQSTFEFCQSVSDAVSRLPVTMLFLFDNDEKPAKLKSDIEEASHRRARFLSVREIENLFLDPVVLHAAIAERCEALAFEIPGVELVKAALARELGSLEDAQLYRQRESVTGPDIETVVGSEVLRRLYWEFALSEYDKVTDGKRLTELALNTDASRLDPIVAVISALVEMAAKER